MSSFLSRKKRTLNKQSNSRPKSSLDKSLAKVISSQITRANIDLAKSPKLTKNSITKKPKNQSNKAFKIPLIP